MLENSLCINEIDAADIRRRIDNSCISLEVFKKKCTEMMLLKEEEQTCPSWLEMKSAEDIIRIVSIEKKDDVATLDKLINPSDITMIVGPSNAGKGMFLLTLLHAIAYKISIFDFGVKQARKVCILDGESGEPRLVQRLSLLASMYPYDQEQYTANQLAFISLNRVSEKKNLLDKNKQEELKHYLRTNNVGVLAFDNINSLVPEVCSSKEVWGKFHDWLTELGECGISCILVHHTNKENKEFKGISELRDLTQTYIKIEGKNQIRNEVGREKNKEKLHPAAEYR